MFPRYWYKRQYQFVGQYLKCQQVSRSVTYEVEAFITMSNFLPWSTAPTRNQGLRTMECLLQQWLPSFCRKCWTPRQGFAVSWELGWWHGLGGNGSHDQVEISDAPSHWDRAFKQTWNLPLSMTSKGCVQPRVRHKGGRNGKCKWMCHEGCCCLLQGCGGRRGVEQKLQKEQEDDERDDDGSSDGSEFYSPTDGDGHVTYTYRWKGKLTKDALCSNMIEDHIR